MADKPSVLRETDEAARRQARTLLRGARYGALAVIDPETGFPSASRVLIGTDIDAVPVILVSALSAHTKALTADTRSSLLVGEPGKGDPLDYPRLGVQCRASRVDRDSVVHAGLRQRFLDRHPKAKLYIDFPDFCFFRLKPQSASLNGGFGRAYQLPGSDLVITSDVNRGVVEGASAALQKILERNSGIADDLAHRLHREKRTGWRIYGIDVAGLDMIRAEQLLRYEFETPINDENTIVSHITNTAYPIP